MLGREGVVYYIMTIIRRIMATQTYCNMAWSDTPRKRVSEEVVIERLNRVRLKQRPRWAREKELLGMARGWGRTWLDGGVNRDHGRVSCATVLCWDALERISSFYDYNCLTASYSPPPPQHTLQPCHREHSLLMGSACYCFSCPCPCYWSTLPASDSFLTPAPKASSVHKLPTWDRCPGFSTVSWGYAFLS